MEIPKTKPLDEAIPSIPGCPPLGEFLGKGRDRLAFVHAENPDWVVKIPRANPKAKIDTILQNRNEISVWHHLKDTEEVKWLAPIVSHCPDGSWIVMARVEKIPRTAYPKKGTYPDWLLDMSSANNWGKYDDRMVACDYGYERIAKALGLKPAS